VLSAGWGGKGGLWDPSVTAPLELKSFREIQSKFLVSEGGRKKQRLLRKRGKKRVGTHQLETKRIGVVETRKKLPLHKRSSHFSCGQLGNRGKGGDRGGKIRRKRRRERRNRSLVNRREMKPGGRGTSMYAAETKRKAGPSAEE